MARLESVKYQLPIEWHFPEDIQSAFIQKVASIPGVEKVYSLLDHGTLRFWVLIEAETREQEYAVYTAEGDMYRQFDEPRLDFLVLNRRSLDDDALEEIIPPAASLLYPR